MNNVFDEVKHDIQSYERKPLSSKEIKVPCLGSNFFYHKEKFPEVGVSLRLARATGLGVHAELHLIDVGVSVN